MMIYYRLISITGWETGTRRGRYHWVGERGIGRSLYHWVEDRGTGRVLYHWVEDREGPLSLDGKQEA